MKEIHVAFGVDANYVKYAGVMITSIVLNQPGETICFHLACDGLNAEDKIKLEQFTKLYRNTKIMIYDAKEILRTIPDLPPNTPNRLNKSVFLRVFLPDFLPEIVERVLYFDADMLCVKSLKGLWEQDLGGNILGALLDQANIMRSEKIGLKHNLYFNAGAMLIDVKRWKKEKISYQVLNCYIDNLQRFLMLEQDALNYFLNGDFAQFPVNSINNMDAFNHLCIKTNSENIIWHFVNDGKPWIKYCDPEIEKIYWNYVKRSLWFEMEALEPKDVKTAFLAGKNAEKKGDYKEAAYYLGLTAGRLMDYYLQQINEKY